MCSAGVDNLKMDTSPSKMCKRPVSTEWNIKKIWDSLLELDQLQISQEEDISMLEVTLLTQILLTRFRKLKFYMESSEAKWNTERKEMEMNYGKLQMQLEKFHSMPCKRCDELRKDVVLYKRKFSNANERMKSIAKILNVGFGAQDDNPAYNLVSQMLLGNIEDDKENSPSPPRKREHSKGEEIPAKKLKTDSGMCVSVNEVGKKEPSPSTSNSVMLQKKPEVSKYLPEVFAPDSVDMDNASELKHDQRQKCATEKLIIPETLAPSCLFMNFGPEQDGSLENPDIKIQVTPDRKNNPVRLENGSPEIGSSKKSERVNRRLLAHIKPTTEHKGNQAESDSRSPLQSPSLLEKNSGQQGAKDRNVLSLKEGNEQTNLKADHPLAEINQPPVERKLSLSLKGRSQPSGDGKKKKRLIQARISIEQLLQTQDLSQLKEFNGGLRKTTDSACADSECLQGPGKDNIRDCPSDPGCSYLPEDEDIVDASPNSLKTGNSNRKFRPVGLKSHVESLKDIDATLLPNYITPKYLDSEDHINEHIKDDGCKLLPDEAEHEKKQAASKTLAELDSSFDRLPEKDKTSPDYKYRRDALRKKSERMKLEGWDCDRCMEYYKVAGHGLSDAQLKERMNQCSRHRDKYPVRAQTPKGFWEPDMTEFTDYE